MRTAKIKQPKTLTVKELFKTLDKEREDVKYFRRRDREIEKQQIEKIVRDSGEILNY